MNPGKGSKFPTLDPCTEFCVSEMLLEMFSLLELILVVEEVSSDEVVDPGTTESGDS